ncbi:MAG: hypothetical protein QOI54_3428 [Actinomycetota bacterium]|nr:hypothetical protein [Actinomycetota bacterium]
MTPVPDSVDDRPPIRGGWVGRQWPLLLVLGGSLLSFAVVALDHFRLGCLGFGASVLFAALARAVLPARRVGLLVVRSRAFDALVLFLMAVSVLVLAVVVPRGA